METSDFEIKGAFSWFKTDKKLYKQNQLCDIIYEEFIVEWIQSMKE